MAQEGENAPALFVVPELKDDREKNNSDELKRFVTGNIYTQALLDLLDDRKNRQIDDCHGRQPKRGPETNLYFEIITAGHKQWLLVVEADTSNWPVMFVELFEQSTHPIVP